MAKYLDPSDTMQIFIDAVRSRMVEMEVRQVDLSKRTGIAKTTLSAFFSGKTGNCSTATMDRISAALGTTTIELLAQYAKVAA